MEQRDPIVTDEDLRNMHNEVDNRIPPDPVFEFNLNAEDSERLWEELDISSLEGSWPPNDLDALRKLVVAFSDVFGFPDKPMHFTGKVKCKLAPLPGAPVPHATPGTLDPVRREWLRGELDRMASQGIARRSTGRAPYSSRCFVIPKKGLDKDGKKRWRLICD